MAALENHVPPGWLSRGLGPSGRDDSTLHWGYGHVPHRCHLPIWGPYLLITLELAKMEDAGFELQLRSRLLLLGDGHPQRGDPLLQLVHLPVPEGHRHL